MPQNTWIDIVEISYKLMFGLALKRLFYLVSRLVMERLLVYEQLSQKRYRLIRFSEVFLQNRFENGFQMM